MKASEFLSNPKIFQKWILDNRPNIPITEFNKIRALSEKRSLKAYKELMSKFPEIEFDEKNVSIVVRVANFFDDFVERNKSKIESYSGSLLLLMAEEYNLTISEYRLLENRSMKQQNDPYQLYMCIYDTFRIHIDKRYNRKLKLKRILK